MMCEENGRSQKEKMEEWFPNKFFHERNLLFCGRIPDG